MIENKSYICEDIFLNRMRSDSEKELKHKRLAKNLLIGFTIGMILLFCLLITLFYKFGGLYWPVLITLISGASLMVTSLILTVLKKYNLSKFIIILAPPYVIMIASMLSKSQGLIANNFTFLAPKLFAIIYIMSPIIFFNLKQTKRLILSIVILSPTLILFDYFHSLVGVQIKDLPYDHRFYPLFIAMTSVFYAFALFSLLLGQRFNFLFRKKIKAQSLLIIEEKEEIKTLNKQLQFQSNLYSILNLTSKNKNLMFILQDVLEQILKIDSLNIENKGLIFLTNKKNELEIAAHVNVDSLLKTCSIIKSGECLCGIVLKNKKKLYCNNVGHNHSIIPEGMTPHGHYVIPILNRDDVLGMINIYIKEGEDRDENIEAFLESVAIVLARKILKNQIKEKLILKNIDFKNQSLYLELILTELNQSINYAQLLQKSLIPNQNTINRYFKESSFLFKPRDKVSGDFYFAHEVDDNLFFGVGDCTGHGIPGAFLAAMSIEAIKTVILTNEVRKPDEILTKLREIAKERFSVNLNEKRSDAMDAALCMYSKKDDKLYYSGGFINLLIIRNNNEIIITPATKCPIGSYPIEYDFELHTIDLQKGDVICLSSDGYVDQFGHDKNSTKTKPSKFKHKRFRELLLSISHLPCVEQIQILKSNLLEWRGDVEQTDDITVFIAKH